MKNKKTDALSFTIPLFPIFIILAILKICGVINCSWWIITAPLWLGFAILFAVFGLILTFGITAILAFVALEWKNIKKNNF